MKSVKTKPESAESKNSTEWFTKEAVAKHKAGESEGAIDYYLEVIKLAKEPPDWVFGNVITLLAQSSRIDQGLELGNQALKVYPESDQVYRAMAIVSDKRKDSSQSIKYYSQAVELNPEQPLWVYQNLTETLTKADLLEQAVAVAKQGIQHNPDSYWLHYCLGEALAASQTWEEAISSYIRSLELKSDFTSASQKLDYALEHRRLKNNQLRKTEEAAPVEPSPDVSAASIPEKSEGRRIVAQISEIALGGILRGWVIDRNPPHNPVEFQLLIDSKPLQTVVSDQVLTDVKVENSSAHPRQFEVRLPIENLDDQEHVFELLPLNLGEEERKPIMFNVRTPRRTMGFIDNIENNCLRGWALPCGPSRGAVNLDIYIDDVFYTEIQANLPRKDLLKHGLGNGKNGFKYNLPLPPAQNQQHKISVVYSGTQQHITRSPLIIKADAKTLKNPIVARVTGINAGGVLEGWASSHSSSDHNIKFKLIIDEQPIAITEASSVVDNVNDKLLINPPKKFEVQLPLDLLDDEEHNISLVALNKTQESSNQISCRRTIPRQSYGVIDHWSNDCLHGWVLPEGHGLSSALLDVYIDGIFYKEIKANILRRDLIKHGVSEKGENGFKIALPVPPSAKSEYEVEVCFKGTRRNLKRSPFSITYEINQLNTRHNFGQFSQIYCSPRANLQEVTIIIPVYNAYEPVKRCLESVFEHTSRAAKLIVINDASPDERIQLMLEEALCDRPNAQLITNEENLGYTRTINKGISLASGDDIVLLNSDTSVGPRWLQNMRIAAYREQDIGTVTAISDNSGAFSVPRIGQANDFPVWLQPVEMARTIHQHSQLIYPETPTGSGFCIYIRRELMNDIGLFDEDAFPRGYGEENDFCMRALRAGWRHIVDDRTLVYHVRSASFQGEKTSLYKPGREVVDQRYPEYKALVTHFVHSPQMDLMRYQVRKLIENIHQSSQPRPRVLFVISTKTGGTPQTNQDLMNGLGNRYHPMLLICDSKEISLYDAREEEHVLLEEIKLRLPINPTAHISKEYDNIVGELLVRYGIELVHIRHIAWHSISLARVTKRLDIPTILSFHDFYTICPTVNLLDENLVFCGGNCTATDGRCPTPIWSEYRLEKLKHKSIHTWRYKMAQMFQYVDAFVTTAPSAKAMMTKIYPQLEQANFKVIPHGRDFPHLETEPTFVLRPPKSNKPLRVLFPGNISSSKGAELIVEIKKLDLNNRLEFHFLGRTRHFLKSVGILHGTYTRADFDQWIQKIRPHCVGIFSIWPETYCHTLTESWASGVPVVAINKGAVGERIARHGCGWLIDEVDPEVIYQKLLRIADSADDYFEKISNLNQWQISYARQNNIATMAAQYHKLYQQVISQSRPFQKLSAPRKYLRLGIFINSQLPPTAHIRVLEWLKHPLICDRLDTQMLDIDAFINDLHHMYDLDAILIQRNIIQPHNVQSLINVCRQRNLPIIYEIDDNLLNVPPDKDRKGVYARTAPAIEALASAASQVIVSTEPLAQKIREYNEQVTIIPNVIAESTWLKPIEFQELELPQVFLNIAPKTFKILYMGNSSHVEDLAMIKPVFERFHQENIDVRLLVIGGEPEVEENVPDWYDRLSIPKGCEVYSNFVPWFRNIAKECNLAIAPLVDNEFNQYKSPLKFLQYSVVELPGIYSNCTPYREIVTDGQNGILIENESQSWYNAILQCINDPEKLKALKERAKYLVHSQYLMSHSADSYVKLFENALKIVG